MASGTVNWFNPAKGYGYIRPADGTIDVLVLSAAVAEAGLAGLNEGQAVSYDPVRERGVLTASNLKAG